MDWDDHAKRIYGKNSAKKLGRLRSHKRMDELIGESRLFLKGQSEPVYRFEPETQVKSEIVKTEIAMELTTESLKMISDELAESKKVLQNLSDDVHKTYDLLEPELTKTIKRMRDHRMTITRELSKCLTTMRDVRKFFLEKEHKEEVSRLKEFLGLAEKLKQLIDDGTMDAITDIILKLED